MTKVKCGRPEYSASSKDRKTVEIMAGGGILQEHIAYALGISEKTLRKHFEHELKHGKAKLDQLAMAGLAYHLERKDKATIFFYLKTRCGWREKEEAKEEYRTVLPNFIIRKILPDGSVEEDKMEDM